MANEKYAVLNTDGSLGETAAISTSAGASSAGKIGALDSTGKWDITMMPTGVGADTQSIVASEALAAGDFVNIYNNAGTRNCRKALATDNTKPAHGFVLSAVASSGTATVYVRGMNTAVAIGSFVAADVNKTIFLSTSVAGGVQSTIPASTGNIAQNLGTLIAVGATATINFSADTKFVVRA